MKQAITPRHIAGGIVLLLLSLLVLVAVSCKTVHKASSQEKTHIDSTSKQTVTITKVDSVHNDVKVTKTDSTTTTKDNNYEVVKTVTTKFDSTGHKKEQVVITKTSGHVKTEIQKAVKEQSADETAYHSNFDSTAAAEVALHVDKEEKHTEVERKPAATAWLSSIVIWLLVIALVGGAIYFCFWRFKKEKDAIANEIHS